MSLAPRSVSLRPAPFPYGPLVVSLSNHVRWGLHVGGDRAVTRAGGGSWSPAAPLVSLRPARGEPVEPCAVGGTMMVRQAHHARGSHHAGGGAPCAGGRGSNRGGRRLLVPSGPARFTCGPLVVSPSNHERRGHHDGSTCSPCTGEHHARGGTMAVGGSNPGWRRLLVP